MIPLRLFARVVRVGSFVGRLDRAVELGLVGPDVLEALAAERELDRDRQRDERASTKATKPPAPKRCAKCRRIVSSKGACPMCPSGGAT